MCHVHADRAATERCGVLLGGAPELVRLDEVRPAVYRVAWSLSSAASGRPRRRTPGLGNHAGDVPCRAPGGPAQGGRAVRPPSLDLKPSRGFTPAMLRSTRRPWGRVPRRRGPARPARSRSAPRPPSGLGRSPFAGSPSDLSSRRTDEPFRRLTSTLGLAEQGRSGERLCAATGHDRSWLSRHVLRRGDHHPALRRPGT